jgi:dihydrofolate synthase/folylpolyglutamate synthase
MLTYSPVIDRDSALAYLQGRINYERTPHIPYRESEFKLDRMRRLLEKLGNPHLAFPALHVAGTKGKGSTATMAAAVLTAAGFRTGLYTSPHLERLEERLVINGEQCREAEFVRLTAEIADAVAELDADSHYESHGATFFEITTALAFLHSHVRRWISPCWR